MALAMTSKAPARRPQVRSRAQRPRRGRTGFAKPASVTPVGPGPVIQPKLTVGAPNDRFEQEADRVADQVMRMPEPARRAPVESGGQAAAGIQRKCSECEEEVRRQPIEEEEEEELQMKRAPGAAPEIRPGLQARIGGLRGGGRPLPPSTRSFFEPRFGYDFGQVRVHSGHAAAEAARSINARAFTVGRDVVLGAGQYSPGTTEGRRLLAHELTHVVQQQGTKAPSVQRLTEAEKAEDLKSQKYAGNRRLDKALDNDPFLGIGESGEAVRLVQEGLVADGFAMPRSIKPNGELDGGFGRETHNTVIAFQRKHRLGVDGAVGHETMGKLDELALGASPPAVQRFTGCTQDQIDAAEDARRAAAIRCQLAVFQTRGIAPPGPRGRPDPGEQARRRARRIARTIFDEDLNMEQVGDIVSEMGGKLTSPSQRFICAPRNDPNCGTRAGFAPVGIRGPINLCPAFFGSAPDAGEQRIRTMVHEAAHLSGIGEPVGESYCLVFDCVGSCGGFDVADSWSHYVHCVTGQTPDQPPRIEGRRP